MLREKFRLDSAAMRALQLSLFGNAGKKLPAEPPRAESPRAAVLPAPPRADEGLAARLSQILREPVAVEWTDNAWTMVSYRRLEGGLRYRLHHMFAGASEPIVKAIAGFSGRQRKAAGRAIDDFIKTHRHLIRSRALPEPELETRGEVHNLSDIYARLNARHFAGRVDARIGWGRRAPGRRRRSIKMGVYFHERKLIKIHPALDDARVPPEVVEMVVLHEMLHQILPPEVDPASGRRRVHGPAFRAAERAFPQYAAARQWEKQNLGLLLRQRG